MEEDDDDEDDNELPCEAPELVVFNNILPDTSEPDDDEGVIDEEEEPLETEVVAVGLSNCTRMASTTSSALMRAIVDGAKVWMA